MYSVKVVAHTVSPYTGVQLCTLAVEYPRFIHAELLTHRKMSRSATSSRAIPAYKLVDEIDAKPAMPVFWGMNQKGMQAHVEATPEVQEKAKAIWLAAKDDAVKHTRAMDALGIHKQIVNRIAEPFQTIRVVLTATNFDNFFTLRNHEDAQPEIRELAKLINAEIGEAVGKSVPTEGIYHLPFLQQVELNQVEQSNFYDWAKVSSARCARASYNNHFGKAPSFQEDMDLFAKLVEKPPIHASPTEHIGLLTSTSNVVLSKIDYADGSSIVVALPYTSRNFDGWTQFREWVEMPNERVVTPLPGIAVEQAPISQLFSIVWNQFYKEA